MSSLPSSIDIAIIGAGAAGLGQRLGNAGCAGTDIVQTDNVAMPGQQLAHEVF